MVEEVLLVNLKEYQQNEKAFDELWKNRQSSEISDFLSNKKEAYFAAILTLMNKLRESEKGNHTSETQLR
jgi:hypothetical protein